MKGSEKFQRSLSGLSTFVQEAFSVLSGVIKSFCKRKKTVPGNIENASEDYKGKIHCRSTRGAIPLSFPLILALDRFEYHHYGLCRVGYRSLKEP